MDNWVTFLLVNVILAVTLGIFTNLATPWVKATYERSIFSSRKRRIEQLKLDYRTTRHFKLDFQRFIIQLLEELSILMLLVILLIFMGVSELEEMKYHSVLPNFLFNVTNDPKVNAWITYLLTLQIISATLLQIRAIFKKIQNVSDFPAYEKKITTKLKKLGGNPEDLDKEAVTEKPKEEIIETLKKKQHRR